MTPARILMAPDSFKGSCGAADVARALAAGWARERPHDQLVLLPLADGGEGTLDAIEAALAGTRRIPAPEAETYGAPGSASWLLLPDGTGVVELAVTNGLGQLVAPMPLHADTLGFGQVISSALDFGVDRLLLAVGGSASSDGGVGALRALGARFLDNGGREIAGGAVGLLDLRDVELTRLRPLPPSGAQVLTDVVNPLLGPVGAAAIYGPQKGATAGDVARIEQGLSRLARALAGVDANEPGAGAAGGTGFGLLAWGATLRSGAREIDRLCGLADAVASCDAVVTGEGRFDDQSFAGKLVGYVCDCAAAARRPLLLAAGSIAAPTDRFAACADVAGLAGSPDESLRHPLPWLREAGRRLATQFER